jgi:hypothetical protein
MGENNLEYRDDWLSEDDGHQLLGFSRGVDTSVCADVS